MLLIFPITSTFGFVEIRIDLSQIITKSNDMFLYFFLVKYTIFDISAFAKLKTSIMALTKTTLKRIYIT